MTAAQRAFLLLYGSEKGQAESIARDLATTAASKDWTAHLFVLNDIERKFWLEKTRLPLVVITSTTGEGDWPENARKFERRLKRRTLSSSHLSHLQFSVLGLGDSNYSNFCNAGKSLDARLAEVGASRFYASAWADDGVGLDLTVDPWLEGLWPALDKHWRLHGASIGASMETPEVQENGQSVADVEAALPQLTQDFSRLSVTSERPLVGQETAERLGLPSLTSLSLPPPPAAFLRLNTLSDTDGVDVEDMGPVGLAPKFALPSSQTPGKVEAAKIVSVARVSGEKAAKCTLLVRIDVETPGLSLQPGDSLGLIFSNPEAEVRVFIDRIGVSQHDADLPLLLTVDPETKNRRAAVPAFLPARGASLRQLLTHFCDLRAVPDKLMLRLLAEHTDEGPQRRRLLEMCSAEGRELHQSALRDAGLTLMDLLTALPHCHPPAARLLERLKQLLPRPYSACSAPSFTGEPGRFELAANVVEVPAEGERAARRGIATGWMAGMLGAAPGQRVWVFKRRNDKFLLPQPLTDTPIVMIGPGTGVAPFRSFLQHLETLEQRPDAWLFFGCRHRDRDWLFREEMEAWERSGVITRLSLAFSRDEDAERKYVQDCMRAEDAELVRWVTERKAAVYVCGDAANMAKDVRQCFVHLLTDACAGGDAKEGERLMARMRLDGKYVEDVWA